jgi:hypothetical protein
MAAAAASAADTKASAQSSTTFAIAQSSSTNGGGNSGATSGAASASVTAHSSSSSSTSSSSGLSGKSKAGAAWQKAIEKTRELVSPCKNREEQLLAALTAGTLNSLTQEQVYTCSTPNLTNPDIWLRVRPQIETAKQAFALFDTDGDGTIPTKQLKHVFEACGVAVTDAELQGITYDLEVHLFLCSHVACVFWYVCKT